MHTNAHIFKKLGFTTTIQEYFAERYTRIDNSGVVQGRSQKTIFVNRLPPKHFLTAFKHYRTPPARPFRGAASILRGRATLRAPPFSMQGRSAELRLET